MQLHLIAPGGFSRDGENAGIPALQAVARHLADRHDVTVVVLRQYAAPCDYTHGNVRVLNLGTVPRALRVGQSVTRRVRLRRFLRGTPPPDIVHAFWIGAPSDLALRYPAAGSVPRVVSVAGGELVAFPDIAYGGLLTRVGRLQADRAFARADALLAGCEESLARIPQREGVPRRVIPLYPETAALLGARAAAREVKQLLTVSNINEIKDPDTLLRAFALLAAEDPELRLTWCGLDVLDGRAQALAKTLGVLDRVHFAGLILPDALPDYYHRAALYVQASRHEAQGVAVCEAAAAGCPIIATDTGIARDLAARGAARVVAPRDPAALAEGLRSLLNDAAQRARLAENAEAWAAQRSATHTAQALEALYRQLLQR